MQDIFLRDGKEKRLQLKLSCLIFTLVTVEKVSVILISDHLPQEMKVVLSLFLFPTLFPLE